MSGKAETSGREAALERLSTPEQLDLVIKVIPATSWFALVALGVLVACLLIGSLVVKVPITVRGDGIIIGAGGVLDLASETEGRVDRFLVHPGDEIHQGQVIAVIEQPDLQMANSNAKARLAESTEALAELESQQAREKLSKLAQFAQRHTLIEQKRQFTADRLAWLGEKETDDKRLFDRQLIPRQAYIDTEIAINEAHQQMSALDTDARQLKFDEDSFAAAQERQRLDGKTRLAEVTRELGTVSERLGRDTEVRSPYDGRIVELKVNPGDVVTKTMPLAGMLPLGSEDGSGLRAVLFSSPADGKKVRPGMDVQIEPSTVRKEEFGFIIGKVVEVAEIPSTSQGMMRVLKNSRLVDALSGKSAPFQIVVELQRSDKTPSGFRWSSSTGPKIRINSGTPCSAEVAVRYQRLISLAIPAMEQLLPSE
ncbi:MAG TPA: NHLP bacteriocin system secretion protein [Magnetospirillaceae bacterium]|nr:NHLP bacteriocin system secretion protein [Magnetospirillaceae bacterium]